MTRSTGTKALRLALLSMFLAACRGAGVPAEIESSPTQESARPPASLTSPASATPIPSISPSASVSELGRREFKGFSVVMPPDWVDQTSIVDAPDMPGQRFVAAFARGMTLCPPESGPHEQTPSPRGCELQPKAPGSGVLSVQEWTHQFPWLPITGDTLTLGGYSAWKRALNGTSYWLIDGPDDGRYVIYLESPVDENVADAAVIETALDTVRLSSWQTAPAAVEGRIHEEPGQGFSFDYPDGWRLFYPQDMSTMDHAVVTVASGDLDPPCNECQRFSTPQGTVAIEFRVGNGPTAPDWSGAPETVGGQPASVQHWGPGTATRADEGESWNVRLNDVQTLGIYISLRGPDLAALRAQADAVLASVAIEDSPAGTG